MKTKTVVWHLERKNFEKDHEIEVDFYSFVDIPNCDELIGVEEGEKLFMGIS